MYRSFHQEMKRRFGCKVYKISLDGGMSCPNRDGTLDTRGCIFCSELGSGDFAAPATVDIKDQLEAGRARVSAKNKDGKYIAYFQSFTNIYAPLSYLRELFTRAIAPEDVVALSIATRPDCLSPETVALLQEINEQVPVWVELGLQTIHEESACYIRRGYPLSCFDDAVHRLKEAGLEVIVHMILGLPGETRKDMEETARHIGGSGANGIKLQLLHVLEGTDLAAEYRKGKVTLPDLEEYTQLLIACISSLPPEMVIHRITGDGPKRRLIAPLWSGDKKRVLNYLNRRFQEEKLQQGATFQINHR